MPRVALLFSFLVAALSGTALGLRRSKPVLKPVSKSLDGMFGSLAAVEKAEMTNILKVFALAKQELLRTQSNSTRTQAAAPAGAPAGAPGASRGAEGGDRIPATGPAWTPPAHLA